MKKNISLNLAAVFVSLILSTSSLSLTLYDDFSGPYIDRTKWAFGELVREIREIEPGNYKLFLKQASPSPNAIRIVGASYPYYEPNGLVFVDPNLVNSIKADVTILENSITNSGFASAGCAGNWYSDGTPGEGRIGDIQAAVVLEGRPSGLFATWNIFKMTNPEGTTWTVLGRGDFATPITKGTPYTLYIEYDSVNNRFIFRVGGEQIEFSTGLPPWAGNAKSSFRSLATRTRIDGENSSASISATFDNVYKNGLLYDNFSSSNIDATKWATYEFVREISNGKLRTEVRTSSASNNEVENMLPSLIPIKAAQAKVTLLDYQNPPGPDFRVGVGVRFEGAFYNDGTQGEGQSGDVNANVRIMANELSTLVPVWEVSRCPDSECDNEETLAEGVFTTPIVLGNTYTLFMEWDGSQFTLKFNDEVANYTPTFRSIKAARFPYINLMTELNATPGHNKEATIEALYDDVEVNEITPSQYALTVSKAGTGSGTVTSSPAGINCGSDCTEDFKADAKVTLKAKPDTNSTFTGWSGGGCSGTGTCVVIMNADTAVTAAFGAKTPDISVSPGPIDFGDLKAGKKITKTLKIANNGSGDLVVAFSGLAGTDFCIQGSTSATIKAKKSYSLKILCTPTSAGLKTATLQIQSNDPDTPTLEVSMKAVLPATAPNISVAQSSLEFGSVKVGKKVTKTLKIANNGTGDLLITLSGLEGTDFSIQGSSSVAIKPKKSYSLKILFTPTSADPKTATLKITSNDPDTPTIDISLNGNVSESCIYILSININPLGSGVVSKIPEKSNYCFGDQVTLTASANSGCSFINWTGDVTGSANPITVTMNGNKTATANFFTFPVIGFNPQNISFNGVVGGSNPAPQILSIWNAGGRTLNWSASRTQSWLNINPTSGSSMVSGSQNQITVAVNILGLSAGTYNDTITISDPNASNNPQSLSVTLTLTLAPSNKIFPIWGME